jgi:hypothetical protein
MSAVAMMHADNLARHAADGEQARCCDCVVVASESMAFRPHRNSQSSGRQDQDEHYDGDG